MNNKNISSPLVCLYGYRNEIICELIKKGWQCNNRCYLNDREIDYFWSNSVGEIVISKTVEFNDSTLQISCYIDGKIGILKIHASEVNASQEFNYYDEVKFRAHLSAFIDKIDAWRPNIPQKVGTSGEI